MRTDADIWGGGWGRTVALGRWARPKVLAQSLDDRIQVNWNHGVCGIVPRWSVVTRNDVDPLCLCLCITAVHITSCISCEVAVGYRHLNWAIMTIHAAWCRAAYIFGGTNMSYFSKRCAEKSILIFAYHSATVNHPHSVTVNHLHCITALRVGHIYVLNLKPLSPG